MPHMEKKGIAGQHESDARVRLSNCSACRSLRNKSILQKEIDAVRSNDRQNALLISLSYFKKKKLLLVLLLQQLSHQKCVKRCVERS